MRERELALRYGINPRQAPARAYSRAGELPFEVLNGSPGYVNLLDALNAWQLVRELSETLSLPAAASFKHVSPAGAAVAVPLTEPLRTAYLIDDAELTPLATAYARARGADRVSSFGDVAAFSELVDVATATLLAQEVSDVAVAPGFEPEALAMLRAKRGHSYVVLRVDPSYEPPALESRDVFGVTLEQPRNRAMFAPSALGRVATRDATLPREARRDLVLALLTVKYTQSNSICVARDGQAIGVGAGQQSRIDCVRIAADKADRWWLRQHPRTLGLRFPKGTRRPERDNAIDSFVRDRLSSDEKREWLGQLDGVSLGSDAFFPFRDSIDRAAASGVRYIAQPCGSLRDDAVAAACEEHGMVMVCTGVRLFHH